MAHWTDDFFDEVFLKGGLEEMEPPRPARGGVAGGSPL